jgi:PAS domain S-box-containing protein
MKRLRRASRQIYTTKLCACHPKQGNKPQHAERLHQEQIERPWDKQECDRFFSLSSDILGIVGFDGYFKRLSPACEQILGFSQEEFLTTPFLEFVHPEDRAATIAVVQQLATGKRVDHFENRYRCKTGTYKWLSWSGIAVTEEEIIYCTARDITTYKQAEEKLQESKQQYEALIQSLNGIVWEFDLRTQKFLFINQKAKDILGYPVEQWLTETKFWENHIHPDDREWVINARHQFVVQKQERQLEYRMIAADGSVIWFQDMCSPVIETDQPTKLRGVLIDISDRKHIEAEHTQIEKVFRTSEQRFRTLSQCAPVGIFVADATGQCTYVNDHWCKLSQLTAKQAAGDGWTKALHPDDQQQVFDEWNAAIQHEREFVLEYRYLCSDGSITWVSGRAIALRDEAGNILSFIGTVNDITDLKRTEAALRESEERFRQIAENIHEVFWIADVNFTQLFYVSPAYEEIWGQTCQSLYERPKSFVEAIHPEDRSQVIAVLEQQRQTGFSHEYRIVQPDGSIRWIWERAFSVPDSAGNPYRVAGVSQDITERKRADEALRLADFSFNRSAFAAVWIGSDARILRVNEGSCKMLGYSQEELQSKYVYELDPNFSQDVWSGHWQLLRRQKTMTLTTQLQRKDGSLVPIETTLNYLEFNGNEYNFAFARDISERLQAEAALRYQREQEQLVVAIAQQIRQSLNLEEILGKTVTAVREFLKSDRVLIYRLEAEIGGCIIAESVGTGWVKTLGTIINDCYFTDIYAQLYQQGRVQAVDDIYTAELTPCHVELLAQFQARANLAVPIAQEDKLWGLLVVQQCDAPRHWCPLEIDLLKQLATQVAIAIQQSELYEQAQGEIAQRQRAETALRQQAERERLLAATAQHIRQSLDLNRVLNTTVTEVRHLLQADRVLLYRVNPDSQSCVITESVAADYSAILGQPLPPEIFPQECHQLYQQGRIRKITDIETDEMASCLAETLRQFQVRSKLVVPILQGADLWGLLIAHQCSGPRTWQCDEVDLLQQLATQVAIAIHQAELHQQVQQLNANLETQVQERTFELQQALEFEALLKRITDKVRDSLDETQILQTAVQALAIGLSVQCCDTALYNFEQESSTVKCEYITSDFPSANGQTFLFANLPEVYGQLLQRQYVQFSTIGLPYFWRGGTVTNLTVLSCPLMDDQGVLGDLWLFRPCEDFFDALEIRLVEQVANQCAIALRQSRLYQAAQAQVNELERLNQLKDDFLSTVSHELRTPMSNIKMAIQMLDVMKSQANPLDFESERTNRYFNILRSECEREINLINDLLDLTRLDAGVEPLNLVTIDLNIWIPHILEPFEQRIRTQQQQVHLCISSTVPPITTDLSYLERVLTELLNNACKYTPAGEQIVISASAVPEEPSSQESLPPSLLITVCNTGVEISSSEVKRIFDKFYRIPNNDPWKHGGTGLGLALVKRLVERMNGSIEVSSCHNQTTFTIQLPLLS